MAVYLQSNNVEIERTGVDVNVPHNDVARLMYYLECVCAALDCNDEPEMQRFTNYRNAARLSIDEQKVLLGLCHTFSPDVLNGTVFFRSDELCCTSANEFYTIHEVRGQLLAAESIIIAGRTLQVNKIMTYKMAWVETYFRAPIRRLTDRLTTASSQSDTVNHTPNYHPFDIEQPMPVRTRCTKGRVYASVCCIVTLVIVIIIIVISIVIGSRKKSTFWGGVSLQLIFIFSE